MTPLDLLQHASPLVAVGGTALVVFALAFAAAMCIELLKAAASSRQPRAAAQPSIAPDTPNALADIDLGRQAEHDQIDTDADLDAFEAAAYWQALRCYQVPRLLAAALVIRRAGTQAVVAHVAADVEG